VPTGITYLICSDYQRPVLRLAAMMGPPVQFVFSHDPIGIGRNGPTHLPVEHLASLRAIPTMRVFRPADAVEAAECWEMALSCRSGPSCLAPPHCYHRESDHQALVNQAESAQSANWRWKVQRR